MSGAKAVAAGQWYSLAIKTDDTLWAWGHNSWGQLADGTWNWRSTPVQVLTGVAAVAVGANRTLALKTDGTLWAWGNNNQGQIGDGTTAVRNTPIQVLTGVAAMASGGWHSLALKTDGSLWAWGSNFDGQLGDGTTTDRWSPVRVSGFVPKPDDFVVTSLVLTPSAPIANGTFSVAVTVKNQGTVAGTPGALQVWANQDAGQNCGAVGDKFTTLTSSLAAGASQTVTLSGLPAGVAGAKTLRAFVDSECLTAEANEANNQATKTYTVLPPAPDFVVTGLVLTPSAPIANGTFSVAVTVKNQGTVAGTPRTLQLWANQAAVRNCGAVGNQAKILTSSLAAGASQTVTLSGLPAGVAGAKTLRAFVDSECLTAEANEANNQATKTYTVLPPAPELCGHRPRPDAERPDRQRHLQRRGDGEEPGHGSRDATDAPALGQPGRRTELRRCREPSQDPDQQPRGGRQPDGHPQRPAGGGGRGQDPARLRGQPVSDGGSQ